MALTLLLTFLLAADAVAGLAAVVEYQPAVVTSDANGTHVTSAGVSAFGVDHDGVGDFLINRDSNPGFDSRCTASLLAGTRSLWAITAAHCVSNNSGALVATAGQVTFATPSGNKVGTVAEFYKHPSYNGNVTNGFDVALMKFDAAVDTAVTAYQLFTGNAVGEDLVHVGYGNQGYGATGQDSGTSGTKRAGLNKFEANGLNVIGISNTDTQLTTDFDSGSAANDAFDFFFGIEDLGHGDDEAGVSQGDSGGPSFVNDSGTMKIAGIHSYGLRLTDESNNTSDVDAALNFSWGEFGVDANVSNAAIADWIVTTAGVTSSSVPEPSSLALSCAAFAIAALFRRRIYQPLGR